MTPFNSTLAWIIALALVAGAAPVSFGQETTKTLTISRVETPPRID